jgi:hypothetical protein
VDLVSSDTERSKDFYGRLLGWEAEEPNQEFGGYFNYRKNGVRVAGCMAAQPDMDVSDVWSVYLTTDDAEKSIAAATASGAQVVVPPMPVGDLGTMAVFVDPTGAVTGLWQPGQHKGFGIVSEAGAPSWFELMTPDYDAAVAFYRDVFRAETKALSDTAEFRYTVLVDGDDWLAGIMDLTSLPEPCAPHWQVYFGVDDTDAALEQVTALGGTVVKPAEDSEYGRIATVADPNGSSFLVVAPNEAMPAKG